MLWDLTNSWKAFSTSCWFWKHFSLQKVVKMLEEVVVGWQEVRWIWRMRQNFAAQLIQLLKHWLCNMRLGIVVENWAHSFDQWCLQALQFSVCLIDMLSILFRCNCFIGIQKAVVDQMGNRPPKTDHDLFLVQVWLWEVLWGFFSVQPVAGHHWLWYKINFSLHVIIWLRKVHCNL